MLFFPKSHSSPMRAFSPIKLDPLSESPFRSCIPRNALFVHLKAREAVIKAEQHYRHGDTQQTVLSLVEAAYHFVKNRPHDWDVACRLLLTCAALSQAAGNKKGAKKYSRAASRLRRVWRHYAKAVRNAERNRLAKHSAPYAAFASSDFCAAHPLFY